MDFSTDFVHAVQSLVLHPGLDSAIILFVLAFLNELVAILPFAIILSGQLLFLKGSLSIAFMTKLFFFVAVPVGVGSSLGAIPIYVLAYFGGKPLIEKYDKFLHFSWHDVERISSRFKGAWYDDLVFLMLRCVPIVPALPVNIAAGIIRMRFWSYFIISTIGFIVRMMLVLIAVGLGVETLSQMLEFIYNI